MNYELQLGIQRFLPLFIPISEIRNWGLLLRKLWRTRRFVEMVSTLRAENGSRLYVREDSEAVTKSSLIFIKLNFHNN